MANPIDNHLTSTYDAVKALRICQMVAEGHTLKEIGALPDMPSRATIYNWLAVYPKFFDAYERAREVSAQTMEEKALEIAQLLRDENEFTNTRINGLKVAIEQYRWSAARRDKARYGQQVVGASTVPITITTTLNLGQDGGSTPGDIADSVYTIRAEVQMGPAQISGEDTDSVESLTASGEVLDLAPPEGDNVGLPWGLPEKERQDLLPPRKPPGPKPRRMKGHKSPAAAKATATRLARKAATKDPPSDV